MQLTHNNIINSQPCRKYPPRSIFPTPLSEFFGTLLYFILDINVNVTILYTKMPFYHIGF